MSNLIEDTDSIKKITKQWYRLDSREILTIPISEFETKFNIKCRTYSGVVTLDDKFLWVGLREDYSQKLNEAIFVHEILHKILEYENYPNILINEEKLLQNPQLLKHRKAIEKLQAFFNSIIEHPEIYRRMKEDYNLDTEVYFKNLVQQKTNRFNKNQDTDANNKILKNQQDILDGIEYQFYDEPYKSQINKLFKEKTSVAPRSVNLTKKLSKIGLYSPEQCLKAAKEVKSNLIRYARSKEIKDQNNLFYYLDIQILPSIAKVALA